MTVDQLASMTNAPRETEPRNDSFLLARSAQVKTDLGKVSNFELAMRRYADEHSQSPARIPRWHLLLALTKQTLKNGSSPHVRRDAGLSMWQLFQDGWRTCTANEVWPAGYYKFKLYRSDRRGMASRFIHEQTGLFVMRELNDKDDVAILDDKLAFAAACARLGLSHVETIAYFNDGKLVDSELDQLELPQEDLFIKSTNLLCGRGTQRWRFDPETGCYQHGEQSLTSVQLLEEIRRRSEVGIAAPLWKRVRSRIPKLGFDLEREDRKPRPYIIQRELRNHPLMERFTNGALCTIRVVTARSTGSGPIPIIAALRMPVGTSRVDNFAAGGLASPINLETGRLGPGVYKDPRKPDEHVHPDSSERITGEIMPFWAEALDLALQAHRSFPRVATVGWDIALTTDGAKLLEANPGWCVEVVQMAHGRPLGTTEWPRLLMSHAH